MVIPTKIFEYAATKLPILFGASGFTKDFISKINGTISYNQNDSSSLIEAILKAKKEIINMKSRDEFLDNYNSEMIYSNYASYILNE